MRAKQAWVSERRGIPCHFCRRWDPQFFNFYVIISKMKINRNKDGLSKVLMAVAIVCLMAGGYLIARRKMRFREAASLPFYKIELSQVNDGMYEGKTYTSFLHLQLKVTVEDHKIKSIDVLENEGIDAETARPIIQKMIEQNSIVVPAIKGAELGSLVYISCVSNALNGAEK